MTPEIRDQILVMAELGHGAHMIASALSLPADEVQRVIDSAKPAATARAELPPAPDAPEVERAPDYPRTVGELSAWLNPQRAMTIPRISGEYAAIGRRSSRVIR